MFIELCYNIADDTATTNVSATAEPIEFFTKYPKFTIMAILEKQYWFLCWNKQIWKQNFTQWALNLGPQPFENDTLYHGICYLGDIRSSNVHALSVLTKWSKFNIKAVADLGGARGMRDPFWPKISSFSCSFRENWPNNRLAPPFGVSATSSGKSWIRHLKGDAGTKDNLRIFTCL